MVGCNRGINEIIRDGNQSGAPPGDLSAFFSSAERRDPSIWTNDYKEMHVCGPTYRNCATYEAAFVRGFFAALGIVDYSKAVEESLTMVIRSSSNYSSFTKNAIAKRWLTCFRPEDKSRLYYFYSSGGRLTSVNREPEFGHIGTIYYLDPQDQKYQEILERCGPLTLTTEIVLPPT